MKNHVATAMALALVAGVVGLSAVPFAAAVDNDCHSNFDIVNSEQDATTRTLVANGRDVGEEPVFMLFGDETLHVELVDAGSNGELTWEVFHKPNGTCIQYEEGGCDQNNVLSTEQKVTCTLQAPALDSKDYWVVFEETSGNNAIDFKAWVTPA